MTAPPSIRVFISSPGDVNDERALASEVIRRLASEYDGRLTLEPYLWEEQPVGASSGFQEQILPPSSFDVVVCLLWRRLGTRLPPDKFRRPDGRPYESGTEFEFLDALEEEKRRGDGRPCLLVYRKTANKRVDMDDPRLADHLEQTQKLKKFFDEFFFNVDGTIRRAFHDFPACSDFGKKLEQHLRELIKQWHPALARPGGRGSRQWPGSPYRGLAAFEYEHSKIFFGRSRATGEVVHALREQAGAGRAFVVILGMSGSGKSSLARAGVLPMLCQENVVEGVALWRRAVFRPGDAADGLVDGLAAAFSHELALPELARAGVDSAALARLLSDGPEPPLAAALAAALPGGRVLLLIDQLEELFTSAKSTDDEKTRFISSLARLARSGAVWVLATLRSDFYARCQAFPELVDLKSGRGQYDLLRPSAEEIGQMIQLPTRMAGLAFEEDAGGKLGLEDELRNAAVASPESLPLLEFALEELYKKRSSDGVLTLAAYREMGGLEGALATRAEETYQLLPPPVQEAMPAVLRHLVSIGSEDRAAGLRPERDAVCATRDAAAFVDAFVAARLFVTSSSDGGEPVIALAHEALLRNWPRLRDWIAADREFLLWRGRLDNVLHEWLRSDKDAGALLGGVPLAEAARWLDERGGDLDGSKREFIVASRDFAAAAEAEREARRRRELQLAQAEAATAARLRKLARVLGGVSLLALGLGSVAVASYLRAEQARNAAVRNANEAQAQRKQAELARKDADEKRAQAVREARIALAERLAVESGHQLFIQNNAQMGLLLAAAACFIDGPSTPRSRSAEWTLRRSIDAVGGELLQKQGARVRSCAVSPDGKRVATGGFAGELELWELGMAKATSVTATAGGTAILAMAFSPDGDWLVASCDDSKLRVLRLSASGPPRPHAELDVRHGADREPAISLKFAPGGKLLAAGSGDGFRSLVAFPPAAGSASATPIATWKGTFKSFSPDGRRLAVVDGHAGTSRLWSIDAAGTLTAPLALRSPGTRGPPQFDAAGGKMVTGLVQGVTIWDLTGPVPVPSQIQLDEADGSIQSYALGLGGRLFALGGPKNVRLWDLARPLTRDSAVVLETAGAATRSIAFSPDGTKLAVGLEDCCVRIWDISNPAKPLARATLLGHGAPVVSLEFVLGGKQLVSRSLDATVRRWHLEVRNPSTHMTLLHGYEGHVAALAFTKDSSALASIGADSKACLWDLKSPTPNAPISVCRSVVQSVAAVALSQDGELEAAADLRGRLVVRSLGVAGVSTSPRVLREAGPEIRAVCLQDGRLAVSNIEGRLELFDLSGTGGVRVVRDTGASLDRLALSPGARWLAAAQSSGAVHLFSAAAGASPSSAFHFIAQETLLPPLAFSPGGRWFATAGHAGKLLLFDLQAPEPGRSPLVLGKLRDGLTLEFGPDGNSLAASDMAGDIYYWPSLAPPAKPQSLTFTTVIGNRLLFSPDGRWLAMGAFDGLVHLWDLKADEVASSRIALGSVGNRVYSLAFSPDVRWLAAGYVDGWIRPFSLSPPDLFSLASSLAIRNLTFEEWQHHFGQEPYRKIFPELPSPTPAN